ncbi:uncharacterized protein FA14DRAFT_153377 [Meira miltonrushii]|uniref:Uncharacterized protein n=1 Tax=Meira miltonrushii TaxID=1280837 RepID=A0A316VKG3_9BASI|nr:uncharacterized protein FA14DRAFT_153377 [Meira miltonrushii]PWN38036.1 hypothetical protein FA14DRAFT_153377 [Meira miltonrushii]
MMRVKSFPLSGQVPKAVIALLMVLSFISCATLTRRDQHIFELAQNDNNRQMSTSIADPTTQLLGALLENTSDNQKSWRSADVVETSSNGPIVIYASDHDNPDIRTPTITEIVSFGEQDVDSDLGHVQRSWLDRNPKSRNLIATGIMGSAIAYALTSVRKASHMDPVPDSVQHALAMVNPVAKPVHKENIKRDEELDSPSFVKRAHGRWRAGALGAALGGFGMYIHSNKLVPDIKESLWPSRNTNGNGKRGITEIIFVRDDDEEVESDCPQKRAGGKNLAYPLYATAAAVGLYGLHKYNNGGFQTQAQTTLQKRSVIPEEPEKDEIQLERRGRGWRDTGSMNARVMISPSHKQVKVYWQSGGVVRFDRQVNNPNGGSSGDEQGNWRTVQSFGARAFLPKDRGQLKIIWRSGNITMYNRNGGGQGNSPPPSNNNGSNNNNNNNGPNSGDFSQPNSAFSSLRMRGHQGCASLTWLIMFALTAFLTLGSVSADDGEAFDALARSPGLEKRQFLFRRANTTQGWTGVHHLDAESKISPTHNLVKVIWNSGNVTTYNRTDGQSPPVLPTFVLPDDEPVMWRTVKSYNAKTQLSNDHEQLRVIWNSGNITNFAKLPPNPEQPPPPNPVQLRSQINNVIPLPGPKSTDNDSNDSPPNNATSNSGLRSKAVGNVGIAGLLLFWCVFFLFSGDVLAGESTEDRINSADLVKRSNVLAAQTHLDNMPVTKRSRLQAGEEEGKNALVRRDRYSGWTPLSAMPARSFISPSHDQLKMERQGGQGPEIFIRDKDTNGPPLPPNHQWQRLRDMNAKARLSQDETRIAVRWNSGSITEYIRRSTLQKRSLPEEDSLSSHKHRFHRRHVSTTAHDSHEHTAKDFQLGRVSPPSHHRSYDQRKAQQAQADARAKKHHKNSAHGNLRRGGLGMNDGVSWVIVFFAFSVLFFASVSEGSELEVAGNDLASDFMAKRQFTQLAGASSVSSPSLSGNVPLLFNSVQLSSIPHSTLGSIQGYKSNTARKALRESPPPEPSQAKPASRKSRLRTKRGPGKSAMAKREVGKNEVADENLLLKRSIATVSSSAPSSAPMSSPAYGNTQSSTAFTQDNWHDGNPGKPSQPRNSVAIHEEFARQYGRKDGIEDSRRELKGGGHGGGGRGIPKTGRGGGGKKSAAAGSSTKNAALLAGGAAVGTAMALNQGGEGGGNAPSSKKVGGTTDARSKKSRLRNKMMSARSLQNEELSQLLIKRADIPSDFFLTKRSVATISNTLAPSSSPANPPAYGTSQTSTAFTQDNWQDGNPGKPARPRNSVAVHDDFVRQYGGKDAIDHLHRELKGSSGGGSSHSGGGSSRGGGSSSRGSSSRTPSSRSRPSPPTTCRDRYGRLTSDCFDSSAGKGKSGSAALMAGGAAAGTAIALYRGGGGGEDTPSQKKKGGFADAKSKKSRLRKQMISERNFQDEDLSMLLVKRNFQSDFVSVSNFSILKRSITPSSGQTPPLSQSNLPSMASSSTSSGLPRRLADHHAEQVRHYETLAKEYPVNRQMFDEKRASVRDSQLPSPSKSGDSGAEPKPLKTIKGRKSHALATGLVATGAAGVAGAEVHRRMRKGAERKGGVRGRRVRFAGIDKRSLLKDGEGQDISTFFKRSIVPYTGQAMSKSEAPLPSITNKPTSSTSSASGLYDVWPNGQPGAPKDLGAHHARQRNEYERLIRLPSSARPSTAQSPQKNSVSNVGLAFSSTVAAAGIAVAGYPIAYQYIDRNRRRRARREQAMNKRTIEIDESVQSEDARLLPRINPPTGKMEKALLIGSSALLAAGGLVATKAVLTPPKPIGEKRDLDQVDESAKDVLMERSPISAGAKNLMIGLGSAAGVGGLTLHALNRDAVHKDKGYGVGKIADQVW